MQEMRTMVNPMPRERRFFDCFNQHADLAAAVELQALPCDLRQLEQPARAILRG